MCRSEAAAKEFEPSGALAGKGRAWSVEPCTVSGSGQTSNCGGQLEALDLEEDEWEQFTEGIARLAAERERKPKDFEAFKVKQKNGNSVKFVEWLRTGGKCVEQCFQVAFKLLICLWMSLTNNTTCQPVLAGTSVSLALPLPSAGHYAK